MFGTAFIWGLGVSFGAAFGLLFFIGLNELAGWLTGRTQEASNVAKRSLEELRRRNELTEETNAKIEHAIAIFETTQLKG